MILIITKNKKNSIHGQMILVLLKYLMDLFIMKLWFLLQIHKEIYF